MKSKNKVTFKIKYGLSVSLLSGLLLLGGFTKNKINFPSQTEVKKFYPSIHVFHESADSSIIFVKVEAKDLLYVRTQSNTEFTATMKVHYKIYQEGTKIPIDSGSIVVKDVGNIKGKTIIAQKKIFLKG